MILRSTIAPGTTDFVAGYLEKRRGFRVGEEFNVSASEELTVAQIARTICEACANATADFTLAHLPSFEVDVQRRWPSVEKARSLLGWEARVDLREGIAVAWQCDESAHVESDAPA